MKAKKNIIKKISHSNKKININFKRELKYVLKKKNFKFKKFNNLLIVFYSLKKILKISKEFKHNLYKTKNNLLINKTIYFNFITNGLDLKFENQYQNLYIKETYINNYLLKNSLISKNNDLNIIKLQKFITIIDNKYIENDFKINYNLNDYLNIVNILFFKIIFEFYINIKLNFLLKIN